MRILIASTLFLMFTSAALAQKHAERFTLNLGKSYVKWVTNQAEEVFTGTFKMKDGYVEMKDGDLVQLVVFVDMQSFECEKCLDNETGQKIVEYVRSEAFFNSAQMDYAVFKMYEHSILENSKDGNFRVTQEM